MARVVLALLLLGSVVWGATIVPGRAFSWAMFSGSSKPFLWTAVDGVTRVPTFEELRLAPDSHYLVLADLHELVGEPGFPVPLHGLIIGTRGSWRVELGGGEVGLTERPVPPGDELTVLADTVRGIGSQPR